MPEISRFLGIVILMHWDEHNPPHFHAKYGDFEITVEIETGIVNGKFPKRALKLVLEWLDINKIALQEDWNKCIQMEPPKKIAPLE